MVAMGCCRPCMASLGKQDSISGHQNQVPLFLHIFQKVEQNNLHHTSSEDASAPASPIASVSGHDSYAKSTSAKRIAQQFAPPPKSLPWCDIIEYGTAAESSFKRVTDTYMRPSLDGYPNHRKNGDALFYPALANDALADASSGAFMAKDILDASLSYDGLNNGIVWANHVSVDETTHGSWVKDRDYIRKQEIEAAPDTGFCVFSSSDCFYPSPVKVASDGNYSIQGEVAGDTIHKSFSAVKKVHDMYANDEREVTHDTGLMKMADTEPEFYGNGSAKVLTTNSLSPRMTRYVQSLENHQAEDFETASIEENLFVSDIEKSGGLESRSCSPKISHLWQDLWHFEEENSDDLTAPFTFESDNGDVIDEVLDIAKRLPKNETLQDHLHPYSGRIDHLRGHAILYKLQKERLFVSAFYLFEWMRLHTPCLLTSRSLCTIFTVSGEANLVDWALVLFNNLRHSKKLWFVQVFNALLSALSKHRRYDEALSVFQEMLNMKIQPDNVTFCILMNLAKRSGSGVKVLWQIFCDMEEQKVFAGHEVFAVLMKAFCEEGSRDEALKLLSLMEGRGMIPNIVIYNILIDAFGKSGLLEEAEGLVSEMKAKGICMSIVTYNILIDAYGNTRNFQVAEALLQEMLDKGPLPNVCSYTALIAAYGRHFLSEKAASIFLRMKKNGVSPNAIAYTALIHAYAEDGWHEKAEYAFENMQREGLIPSVETYTSLLHAFRQAGDLRKVKSVWKMMRSERCIGTRATFNVLLDACAKQGDYAEARHVMYEFNKIGIKPNRKTYNILINAYGRGGQHDRLPEILKEMKSAGFSPDCFTYTTLIFSYLRVRDFTQAFKYHERMCRDNQLPDAFTYRKLRALLDEKYEIKTERNMKAVIGIQRAQYSLVEDTRKVKSFSPRQLHR